jgi:hypothetical protein
MRIQAAAMLLSLPNVLWSQSARFVVEGEIVPAEVRSLPAPMALRIWIQVAGSQSETPCAILAPRLHDSVLCVAIGLLPPDLPVRVTLRASAYRLYQRTVPPVPVRHDTATVDLGLIQLITADLVADPAVQGKATDSSYLFQLALRNSSERTAYTITSIAVFARRLTGLCEVGEPVPVFALSARLAVDPRNDHVLIGKATELDETGRPSDTLRVTGHMTDDPCSMADLRLAFPVQVVVPANGTRQIHLYLPRRFHVDGRSFARDRDGADSDARAVMRSFAGVPGAFDEYSFTFDTNPTLDPPPVAYLRAGH